MGSIRIARQGISEVKELPLSPKGAPVSEGALGINLGLPPHIVFYFATHLDKEELMATRMSVNPPKTLREDEVVTYTCGACDEVEVTDPTGHIRAMGHDRRMIIDTRFLNYYNTKENLHDRRTDRDQHD